MAFDKGFPVSTVNTLPTQERGGPRRSDVWNPKAAVQRLLDGAAQHAGRVRDACWAISAQIGRAQGYSGSVDAKTPPSRCSPRHRQLVRDDSMKLVKNGFRAARV
jgi:hypothetical protein